MQEVFAAVIPVFGLIWLGYFFKRIQMPGDGFWPFAERITYYVFLPSLFFQSIMKADFEHSNGVFSLLMVVVGAMATVSALTFLLQNTWLKLDGRRFASFYQGSIRFNNYVGIPIVISLYGNHGMLIYAIIIGAAIPLTNILVVAVMTHYASDKPFRIWRLICSVFTNPLIVASLLGVVFNIVHIPLFYAERVIHAFASAATALGLLTVGAGIDFESITSSKRNLSVAMLIKLVINPLVVLEFCLLLGVSGEARDVVVIYAALPVAASSYIMARQFGAHSGLMSSIIVTTVLGSMLTLSVLLVMLQVL